MSSEEKNLIIRIKANTKQAIAGFKHFTSRGRAQLNSLQDKVLNLKTLLASFGAGLLAKSFLDTASQMEQFKLQLETIEGSSTKANKSLDWIQKFAKTTPNEIAEVTAAFVKLKAYGIDPIADDTLRILGDTSAAMGKTLEQSVEAMADAATGEFERLKEFGIKASVVGDKVRLTYAKNGKEMVAEADRNSREMIQSTLLAIWNDKYAGGMKRQSEGWKGIWSNIKDNWTLIQDSIMGGGLFDYIKAIGIVIRDATGSALDESKAKAVSWSNTLINGIRTIFKGVGFLGDAFRGMQAIWKGLEIAWSGFKLAILAGLDSIQQPLIKLGQAFGQEWKVNQSVSDSARDTRAELDLLKEELHNLLMRKLPSQGLEDTIKDIEAQFVRLQTVAKKTQDAVDKVAGNNGTLPIGLAGEATQALDDWDRALDLIDAQFKELDEDYAKQIAGLGELQDAGSSTMTELVAATKGWGDEFTNTLVEMVKTGKLSFKSLADSIISDILRIMIYQSMTRPLMQSMGFISTGSNHSGGLVGAGGSRSVSPSVFAGAPRYHTGGVVGLAPRERPIIALEGEEVLTQNDPRHIRNQGKGGGSVRVVLENTGSPKQAEGADASFDADGMVIRIFTSDVQRGGPMSRQIENTYKLRRGS